ncbi:hypothetical protein RFI_03428 [Reticulomyxa filosa]|uniref:Uncharacterized protein n=1 Tax=Reticulomyxa filosa TaxID=46433 RepID=X6P6D6_RETFI|nr:hypothetical protein RFI_03428 [Reticulomyxa filosa]|eukprot:ETO33678.1 hypothetical protein RFI_03428 [Reticulomyxa filosa]
MLRKGGKRLVSESMENINWPTEENGRVSDLCLSPDDNIVATISDNKVHLWDSETGALLAVLEHNATPSRVVFKEDDGVANKKPYVLFVPTYDGHIHEWHLTDYILNNNTSIEHKDDDNNNIVYTCFSRVRQKQTQISYLTKLCLHKVITTKKNELRLPNFNNKIQTKGRDQCYA